MSINHQRCPCGSGKAFQDCCGAAGSGRNPPGAFSDVAAVEDFVESFRAVRNSRPVDDFHGLSPDQMEALLCSPFDAPDVVRFEPAPPESVESPLLRLFGLLAEAIGERGIKPTATGNLPRNLCRDIALAYWGSERYEKETRFGTIRTELDFGELHRTRVIAELAGFIRNHRGRFTLSRKVRSLLAGNELAQCYGPLLQTGCETFNWAYDDGYPEIPVVQESFAFTLYLLHRYGKRSRLAAFYEEAFERAFPVAVEEMAEYEGPGLTDPSEDLARCFSLRVLLQWLPFMGFVTVESIDGQGPWGQYHRIKQSPIFDRLVRFLI